MLIGNDRNHQNAKHECHRADEVRLSIANMYGISRSMSCTFHMSTIKTDCSTSQLFVTEIDMKECITLFDTVKNF